MEILAPAGSVACVEAAAQNGADAVYMGYGAFHARQNAPGFTKEEFFAAISYCRVRGVKVYATLNTLVSDRELISAVGLTRELFTAGVDAVLIQDLGMLRMVRMVAPSLPVHASTQMGIHSLDGVRQAHALGCSRVVLARELSREQIAFICANSPIPVEVFVHGALCLCHSGQCYMSAAIGGHSGNRGLCAGPCRMPYSFEGRPSDTYPLSLKDLSLLPWLRELREMGVAAVKIEGRMRGPEYVAAVTRAVSEALALDIGSGHKAEHKAEHKPHHSPFTDGYYTGSPDLAMFGPRRPDSASVPVVASGKPRSSHAQPGGTEPQRVPVRFACLLTAGQPAMLAVEDDQGHTAAVQGQVPSRALESALPEAKVRTQLYKTGGTPYRCVEAQAQVDKGLNLPTAAINAMRREALEKLSQLRGAPYDVHEVSEFKPGLKYLLRREPPAFTVQITRTEQLTGGLLSLSPSLLYIPLWELVQNAELFKSLLDQGVPIAASLPWVCTDQEAGDVEDMLKAVWAMGVRDALIGNLGQCAMCSALGFTLRGDFGLNVYNSQALKTCKQMGLRSAALSVELGFAQIRDLSHCMDTELIAYGRLPLMLTDHCLIKYRTGRCACENKNVLHDRMGALFPVLPTYRCRNILYNAHKIFLADRQEDYRRIGLWAIRLLFTTENPRECLQAAERYLGRGPYEPNGYTRGLYYRGVQ
ncbi:MAG: DUF3656 domain-containing protein [Oscillospiraceae bacterium]|nr:DUF3656 domain-containing protein [Oscillospiraceae bacterium]